MKIYKLVPGVLLSAIFLVQCTKSFENEQAAYHGMDLPMNISERLWFRDHEHLVSFYKDLDAEIELMQLERAISRDSALAELEHQLGHVSARRVNERISHAQRTEDSLSWLKDELRLSLLNQYFEVAVGDSVYIYTSENQMYRVHASDSEAIAYFRSKEKGDDGQVDLDILKDDVSLLSKKWTVFKKVMMMGDCVYSLVLSISEVPCEPNERVFDGQFTVTGTYTDGTVYTLPAEAQYTIDFGDGSGTFEVGSTAYPQFSHVYPGPGEYEFSVDMTYPDFCNDGQMVNENYDFEQNPMIEIGGSLCSSANMSEESWQQEGDKKMHSELWVKHDIFGEHQVARTTSWEHQTWLLWDGWYKEDCYVYSSIHWEFRDSDCLIIYDGPFGGFGGDESQHCNSCDSKRVGRTHMGDGNLSFADDAVYSYHTITNDGVTFEENLVLSICD